KSGAGARPSCRSSSASRSGSTTGRSTSPCSSRKKWSATSSASSRRPASSTDTRPIARQSARRQARGRRRRRRRPPAGEAETRGKRANGRSLAEKEGTGIARMLRISPQKLNLLAALIRGKKVATALADLEFSRKRVAKDVRKCLESAIANAENNHDLDVDDLVVAEAHVGKALVIKRHAARARGRVGAIFKPFANLTIVVREVEAQA